jgi:hypothetical protein
MLLNVQPHAESKELILAPPNGEQATGSFVPFTAHHGCSRSLAVQPSLSKSITYTNQSFASILLAIGVLSSFHSPCLKELNGRYRVNNVHLKQPQQSTDDLWYTPLRSPAVNDLIGS